MSAAHAVWSRPQLAAQVLRRRRDGQAEVALRVPTLATPHQVLRLEQQLLAERGVARVAVDTLARRLRVRFDDTATPLPRLLAACDAAGCPAQPLAATSLDDARRREADESLRRLLVAGIFAMQAMMFALVLYLGVIDAVDTLTTRLFRWLGLLSAAPVIGYAAWPFFRRTLAGVRARRAGIDLPIALAIGLIYGASVLSAVRGGGEVYFDSVSMFVFVLLLGRHLELRARHRNGALGEAVADAAPLVAERRNADGALEPVAVSELLPGDRVHVAEGGVVPADGLLESANVQVDAALLSGESRACTLRRGQAVDAGSVVLDGPLELRVERTSADSAAGRLGALADAARRGRQAQGADDDPAATRFVLRVLTLAAATVAFWLWRDPARTFDAAVAVLVVACPCAFALAAPATMARAMAVLARRGVLVARPCALRALARVNHALLDKTGTLTEPTFNADRITSRRGLEPRQALRLAVALARESSHPAARAVARRAGGLELPQAREVEVVAGGGIRGRVDGRVLRLGRAGFACAAAADDEALWLADERGALARLPLQESLRPQAQMALSGLRDAGIAAQIASGDVPSRVRVLAARLGIDAWRARQSPADKLRQVRDAQAAGDCVLVVGDGSNDAAALAAADVSASLAGASELARAHADLLLNDGLGGLLLARQLAARAAQVLRQNRRWALAYNMAAIPFAALGFVPPWLAALGMSLSSLAVILNTLRIAAPLPAAAPPALPRLRERTA
ncbi:MAG TPA: heavy metal translocating P-type ATPase [Rhodanobacteraceae bacterium]|nr:heavy metal translocating P-type ATPase [Rhodanobacteraceae bacterium]